MDYALMVLPEERGLILQPADGTCLRGLVNVDGLCIGAAPAGGPSREAPRPLFVRRFVPYVANGAVAGSNLQSLRNLVQNSTMLNERAIRHISA